MYRAEKDFDFAKNAPCWLIKDWEDNILANTYNEQSADRIVRALNRWHNDEDCMRCEKKIGLIEGGMCEKCLMEDG